MPLVIRLTPGIMPRMSPMGPIFLIWRSWSRKSSKSKLPSWSLRSISSASCLADVVLGAFDERQHVAHAEYASGESFRLERFEVGDLFAGAQELDGHAGDFADAKGGAAARVAVNHGHDESGDGHALVEALGDVDGFLTGHGVDDQQHLRGPRHHADLFELAHHVVVDLQTAGRVDDDGGVGLLACHAHSVLGDGRRRRVCAFAVHGDVELVAQHFQLVDGGWTVGVCRQPSRGRWPVLR